MEPKCPACGAVKVEVERTESYEGKLYETKPGQDPIARYDPSVSTVNWLVKCAECGEWYDNVSSEPLTKEEVTMERNLQEERAEQCKKINEAVGKTYDYFEGQAEMGVASVYFSELDGNAIITALNVDGTDLACEYGIMLQYFLGEEFDICHNSPTDGSFLVTENLGMSFDPAESLRKAQEGHRLALEGDKRLLNVLDHYLISYTDRTGEDLFECVLSTDDYLEQCIRIDHGIKDYYIREYRLSGEPGLAHLKFILNLIFEQTLYRQNIAEVEVQILGDEDVVLQTALFKPDCAEKFNYMSSVLEDLLKKEILQVTVRNLIR